MRTPHRTLLLPALVSFLLLGAGWTGSSAHAAFPKPQTQTPDSAEIPVLKADAGPCAADFVVRDSAGKGLYDAKVTIHIQYGFLGTRKLDLSVGTNWEGKARIEGLPEKIRKTAEFKITHGNLSRVSPYEPLQHCTNAQHEITLGE